MPNDINSRLDFERRITEMGNRDLLEFVARRTFDICGKVESQGKRISYLENGARKVSSITGAIAGSIMAGIIGAVNYFSNYR